MRVPSHVSQAVSQINQAAQTLGINLDDRSQLWKEADQAKRLAEEAGLSQRNVEEALKVRQRRYTGASVPFESWMQQGKDLVSDVGTPTSLDEESLVEREALRRTLSQFLRPKEMEALSWRYGLMEESADDSTPQERANAYLAQAEQELFGNTAQPAVQKGRFGEAMSFVEVGKKMQVSAEYTRRLCHKALAKLQQAAAEGQLDNLAVAF